MSKNNRKNHKKIKVTDDTYFLSDEAIIQIIDILQFGMIKQQDITDKFRDIEYRIHDGELFPAVEIELYSEEDKNVWAEEAKDVIH